VLVKLFVREPDRLAVVHDRQADARGSRGAAFSIDAAVYVARASVPKETSRSQPIKV
jgi:hypothetical protein